MASYTKIAEWRLKPGTGQNLTLGAASVSSTVLGTGTYWVQVSATGNCHIRIGAAPTAVATDTLVKSSDPPRIYSCQPGDKVAVIQDGTSTGTLNICEVTHG